MKNKQAWKYVLGPTIEAGICLSGTELPALRNNKGNISGSYVHIENKEVWWFGAHIQNIGKHYQHEPDRKRKLLLHRRQISRLIIESRDRTIIPIELIEKDGIFKLQIAVANSCKKQDIRQRLKEKEYHLE